jgi:hypothetical protein
MSIACHLSQLYFDISLCAVQFRLQICQQYLLSFLGDTIKVIFLDLFKTVLNLLPLQTDMQRINLCIQSTIISEHDPHQYNGKMK